MISFSPSRTFKVLMTCAMIGLSGLAHAEKVFKVTAIPDESPTELARKAGPLMDYLSKKLNMKVVYTPVTDYAAAVEALANNKVDLAWFGGFTFVQANDRSKGHIIPLVQRVEDEKFKSIFIATDPSIKTLDDLKGKTFSFGSASSTSGHLMPRYYLLQAHINPDKDFKRIAFSGAHDATLAAVAAGKVEAGVLSTSVWDEFVKAGKVDTKKVHVIYTTPTYYDYNWSVNDSMPAAEREKIKQAFLDLKPDTPEGKQILELQRATKFVPTSPANYKGIEESARSAGLLK